MKCRRAVILPAVLFVLLLVGLLSAMFAFRVNADLASQQAVAYRLQTRLAAEAGVERIKLLLRDHRLDQSLWYNNPDELHRIVVWSEAENDTSIGTNEEYTDNNLMVYRFSIVADDPTDAEEFVRFGITDESSKLNLNTATEAQLLVLVTAAVDGDEEIIPQNIVDAILDWRDPDANARGEAGDTEGVYYHNLPKPYRVKNGPFDTVEELLLVKGVTGRILYGEDYNRTGIIEPNEKDGDATFPPDNEDDILNRGLYPYLTVRSYESNTANDNRPRTYLFGDKQALRDALELEFGDEPNIVEFILSAVSANNARQGGAGGPNNPGNAGGNNPQAGGSGPGGDNNAGNGQEGGQGTTDGPEAGETNGPEAGNTGGESDGVEVANRPIRSPATLLLDRRIGNSVTPSPVTEEHLAVLMDRFTAVPPDEQKIVGLINVNTAPRLVLETLPGLTGEQIDGLLEARDRLTDEDRMTPAWLVTEGVLDPVAFDDIAPLITARGQQFMVESLGYADHIGMVTRLEVVLDLMGPIPQTVYYRDVTQIGGHFPIREEDLDNVRIR